jgi:hypothetical protein
MKAATFECSMADRWVEMGARLGVGLAGAAVVAWGVYHGIYGAFVAAALLCGPFFWAVARPGWRTAWRVVVSDESIEATRSGGRRVCLSWDGVGEVQHFVRATIQGPVRLVRLVSIDRQLEVIFNDRLPRFEELMGFVEARVRHVSAEEATSWGRLLWSRPRADGNGRPPSMAVGTAAPVGASTV